MDDPSAQLPATGLARASLTKVLLGINLAGLLVGVGASLAVYYVQNTPFQSNIVVPIEKIVTPQIVEPVRSDFPLRLKIPKLKVDAPIQYVGLTAGGAMAVPKDPNNVAWFNLGPRPGEVGSAVIAGHFGWRNNIPAVFDDLYKLRPGDTLSVEDDRGVSTTFVVRESRRYDPAADASEVFLQSDGIAHLNLVTCEGTWNVASDSYSRRLVVLTDKQ